MFASVKLVNQKPKKIGDKSCEWIVKSKKKIIKGKTPKVVKFWAKMKNPKKAKSPQKYHMGGNTYMTMNEIHNAWAKQSKY
jgi:hypothetical protein